MNRARGVSVCAASARSLWLSKPSRSRRRKITARSCGSRSGARNAVPCGWSRVRPSEAKGCASAQHRSACRHKRTFGDHISTLDAQYVLARQLDAKITARHPQAGLWPAGSL
jgi:hypothetical protein